MPTVTTRYVIYASRRRRHAGGGVTDIQPSGNSTLANGDNYQVPPGFPSLPWVDPMGHVHNLQFAFWSVTGGTNGPVVSFPGQSSPSIPVGNGNITATAWYIDPSDGGPGGGPGIIIDAFDESIGDFVFDDFVSCAPGDATFNTNANWDGFAPTTVAENVTAFGSIHGVPFDQWKIELTITPLVTVSGMQLSAAKDSVAFAFAFYKPTNPPGVNVHPGRYQEGTWVSWGVMVDGGGPTGRGPVGPWDPNILQCAAGMALMEVAMKVNAKLAPEVMALAAKQIEMAGADIAGSMKNTKFNAPAIKAKG